MGYGFPFQLIANLPIASQCNHQMYGEINYLSLQMCLGNLFQYFNMILRKINFGYFWSYFERIQAHIIYFQGIHVNNGYICNTKNYKQLQTKMFYEPKNLV